MQQILLFNLVCTTSAILHIIAKLSVKNVVPATINLGSEVVIKWTSSKASDTPVTIELWRAYVI
jgi:hypothetical protein